MCSPKRHGFREAQVPLRARVARFFSRPPPARCSGRGRGPGWGLSVLAALLPGCGGMDFGGEIRVPVSQRHILKADQLTGRPINLPADRSFNIHVKKSSQDPGPAGEARGESDATADGRASCLAKAENGGSASAEFNIGHRIENLSSSPQCVVVELHFDLRQSISASPLPAPKTLAAGNVQLLVMDAGKRNLVKIAVVQVTSDEAAGTARTRDQRNIPVRFEPGQSYDIMLFGRVEAAAEADQEAVARLDLEGLRMHLTFSPADTQPAAD